jgi:translation initiation factor 1
LATDPLADAESATVEKLSVSVRSKNTVHVRLQQRNGTKCITTVSGLSKKLDLKRIVRTLKKLYACNGTVLKDDTEEVIQLQGDHREAVQVFLLQEDICSLSEIQVHGF